MDKVLGKHALTSVALHRHLNICRQEALFERKQVVGNLTRNNPASSFTAGAYGGGLLRSNRQTKAVQNSPWV